MAKQMRAAVFHEFGDASRIQISAIDIPELREGEVLVKIKAASVNPVDSAVRTGYLKALIPVSFILLAILSGCYTENQRLPQNMVAEFVRSEELKNYPSGSTISFYKGRLYLMGDDASSLMILDPEFKVQEEIHFFVSDAARIKKTEKADIESSEWIVGNNKAKLWLFGSGSLSPKRDSAFCFDPETQKIERIDLNGFYKNLISSRVPELNIEGTALVKQILLFGSRGNLSNTQNYLIQTPVFNFPQGSSFKITPLELPVGMGISGMSYLPDQDILLITSSTENTLTAFDDGEIGESSLGLIYNFSDKLADPKISADEWIVLSELHADFSRQKIESICTLEVEPSGDVTAILVSDDDKGATRLFELKLRFQQ